MPPCIKRIPLSNDNYNILCNPYKQLADQCHKTSCGNITEITNPKPFLKQDNTEIFSQGLVYNRDDGYNLKKSVY